MNDQRVDVFKELQDATFTKEFMKLLSQTINIEKIQDSITIVKQSDLKRLVSDLEMLETHAKSLIIDKISDKDDCNFLDLSEDIYLQLKYLLKNIGKVVGAVQQIRKYIYGDMQIFEGKLFEFDREFFEENYYKKKGIEKSP